MVSEKQIKAWQRTGVMTIDDYIALARMNPTSLPACSLKKGDYVISLDIFRKSLLDLDAVKEIDYMERGDFSTRKGAFGPIEGNVFLQRSTGRVIMGKNVNLYDPSSVPGIANKRFREVIGHYAPARS
jgi:hypothetical protein